MAVVRVKNAAALQQAMTRIQGGDTIVLAPGDYGALGITRQNFSTPITIVSASRTNMAHFDTVNVTSSSGVVLRALDVGRELRPGEAATTNFVTISSSNNVVLDRFDIRGLNDNASGNDGQGISFRASSHITVTNSIFDDLYKGVSAHDSNNLTFRGNSFTDIGVDALAFAANSNVIIDNNRFTDFRPQPGLHSDAIQFGTTGKTVASSNITITNNVMTTGTGGGFQGVLISDQVGTLPYSNVTITNNRLNVDGSVNGIFLAHTNNFTISGNTVVSNPNDGEYYRIRLYQVTNGVVNNNETDRLTIDTATNVQFTNNRQLNPNPKISAPTDPVGVKPLADATGSNDDQPAISADVKNALAHFIEPAGSASTMGILGDAVQVASLPAPGLVSGGAADAFFGALSSPMPIMDSSAFALI